MNEKELWNKLEEMLDFIEYNLANLDEEQLEKITYRKQSEIARYCDIERQSLNIYLKRGKEKGDYNSGSKISYKFFISLLKRGYVPKEPEK